MHWPPCWAGCWSRAKALDAKCSLQRGLQVLLWNVRTSKIASSLRVSSPQQPHEMSFSVKEGVSWRHWHSFTLPSRGTHRAFYPKLADQILEPEGNPLNSVVLCSSTNVMVLLLEQKHNSEHRLFCSEQAHQVPRAQDLSNMPIISQLCKGLRQALRSSS